MDETVENVSMHIRHCNILLLTKSYFLPPANKVWGKVIFCTCLSFCSRGKYLGRYPPGRYTTWQLHPRAVTPPPSRYTPSRYPLGSYTPCQVHTPRQVLPRAGTPSARYTSWAGTPLAGTPPGRYIPECMLGYASYWNAFLFKIKFQAYLLFRSS